MKRSTKAIILSMLMSAILFVSCVIPAFAAAAPEQDGIYSVPVTMLDPKKDKESMGNRFIEHTAMITVKNGVKTITVLMPKESDLVFCYYVNGSVSGDAKQAKKVSNIELDGKTYPVGYTFPLVKDSGPVGLYFELSFLGIKPSARLSPDYSKLKTIKLDETETETETEAETESVIEEEASNPDATTAEGASTVIAEEPSVNETGTEEAVVIGGADETTDIAVSSTPVWVYAAAAVAAIAVIAVVATIIKKKKNKGE